MTTGFCSVYRRPVTLFLWTETGHCCSCSGTFIQIVDSEATREDTERCLKSMLIDPDEGAIEAVCTDIISSMLIKTLSCLIREYVQAQRHRSERLRKLFVPSEYKGTIGSFALKCDCESKRVSAKIQEEREAFTKMIVDRLPIKELQESAKSLEERKMIDGARRARRGAEDLLTQVKKQVDLVFRDKEAHLRTTYTHGKERLGPDPRCPLCLGEGHEVITL